MINRTFYSGGKTYKRINKTAAKTAYYNNETIVICACNLQPFTMWHNEYYTSLKTDNEYFEKLVYAFEYYNCINSETGKYAAFYKAE